MTTYSVVFRAYKEYATREKCAWIREAVEVPRESPYISEVVVVDDCSPADEWDKLCTALCHMPKVRLVRGTENVGAFNNRLRCARAAETDWIFLMDSDNCLTLEGIEAAVTQAKDPNVAYCASFARPNFDFTRFAGQDVTANNTHLYEGWDNFPSFFNVGNQLLHCETYKEVVQGCQPQWYDRYRGYFENQAILGDARSSFEAVESAHSNYLWLAAGHKLHITPGFDYHHRSNMKGLWCEGDVGKEIIPALYLHLLHFGPQLANGKIRSLKALPKKAGNLQFSYEALDTNHKLINTVCPRTYKTLGIRPA